MERFMAEWYEVYSDLPSRFCVTNFYRERENGYISVHHTAVEGAVNGTFASRNGYMIRSDPDEPGKFYLFYDRTQGHVEYWIIDLGPVDNNGMYSYAITTDETGSLLWVMTRSVSDFFALYNDEVLEKLEDWGFAAPVPTYQGSDCEYENLEPVMPVQTLEVSQYMGMWYEMYTDGFVRDNWENDTFCHQKNYALRDDAVIIGVHNYHTIGSPNGESSTITGYMIHNDNMPGEFLLHFPHLSDQAMHVWVLDLGPVDQYGQYSYAITSDPTGTVMWVLARNVTEFNALYDSTVNQRLEELGFYEGDKEPVSSYQGDDCKYENIEEAPTASDFVLSKFYGFYYEVYTDDFVSSRWERDAYCSTVTYSERKGESGFVNYRNDEKLGAPNGSSVFVEGYMSPSDDENNAKFDLHLPSVSSRSFPYWVLDVGPLDMDGMYSYVIMGGNTGLTMWVLARNVTEFNIQYDAEVKNKLESMGYINGDRMPVASYQGSYCVYESNDALNQNDDLSTGAEVGLALIIIIAIGIFGVAIVMFVKERPTKSWNATEEEESEHLVAGATNNPISNGILGKSSLSVDKSDVEP